MANKRKAPVEFSPRKTPSRQAKTGHSAVSTPNKAKPARIGVPTASPSSTVEKEVDLDEPDEEVEAVTSQSTLASLPSNTLEAHLPTARARVLSILAGALPPRGETEGEECIGLAKQWNELRGTLWSTTSNKEGNSTLLIGARGVGKSLLLDSVLRSISTGPCFHHVHLDAALQSTDAIAMRELARQLVKAGAITLPDEQMAILETEPVDPEAEQNEEDEAHNHEEEEDAELEALKKEALEGAVLSSIAATTSTILTLLSTSGTSSKPLLISLANFDLFTSRPRQALLYVLLDAVQAGSYTPGLGVIGLTSRLDTPDLFEKRVRSRFSGRTLNLYAPNRERWEQIAREALAQGAKVEQKQEDALAFAEAWRMDVEQLFEDQRFQQLLQDQHDLYADVRSLYRIMTIPVSNLTVQSPSLSSHLFLRSAATQRTSTQASLLSDLTTSEFAMLIAAKHLQTRDRSVFNFEMCYFELQRWLRQTQRDLEGAGTGGVGLSVGGANRGLKEGGALGDRRKALVSFTSLLDLELFLPEAMFASIAHLPGPQAGAASLAKTARGAVRPEYLRVRCVLDGPVIARAAKSRGRREALGTAMVQWASSAGS